jgi:proteasome maturation protein
MNMLRREFGVAEPIRRAMELKICQEGEWRPRVLGFKGEGVSEEVLSGRDASVEWEDVFNGEFEEHVRAEGRKKGTWLIYV